jgi:PIN domain nuclease of toxin-antitoxin system
MRLLLDTHYLLWATVLSDHLTLAERRTIESHDVIVSAVSLWELRIKWQTLGRDGGPKGPADPADVREGLDRLGVEIVPLTAGQSVATLAHPMLHRNPFDELLLVQAQELDAKLLTRDGKLAGHPLVFAP